MSLAGGTNAGNFDHRVIHREAEVVGLREQVTHVVFEFGDPIATPADQKPGAAALPWLHAGNERVAAFDAVNQALADQEFEGAVDYRRGDPLGAAIQFGEDIVGA